MKKVAEIILILFVATICGFYSKEYYDNVKAAKLFTNDYLGHVRPFGMGSVWRRSAYRQKKFSAVSIALGVT